MLEEESTKYKRECLTAIRGLWPEFSNVHIGLYGVEIHYPSLSPVMLTVTSPASPGVIRAMHFLTLEHRPMPGLEVEGFARYHQILKDAADSINVSASVWVAIR